jgi:hypothetical protein
MNQLIEGIFMTEMNLRLSILTANNRAKEMILQREYSKPRRTREFYQFDPFIITNILSVSDL